MPKGSKKRGSLRRQEEDRLRRKKSCDARCCRCSKCNRKTESLQPGGGAVFVDRVRPERGPRADLGLAGQSSSSSGEGGLRGKLTVVDGCFWGSESEGSGDAEVRRQRKRPRAEGSGDVFFLHEEEDEVCEQVLSGAGDFRGPSRGRSRTTEGPSDEDSSSTLRASCERRPLTLTRRVLRKKSVTWAPSVDSLDLCAMPYSDLESTAPTDHLSSAGCLLPWEVSSTSSVSTGCPRSPPPPKKQPRSRLWDFVWSRVPFLNLMHGDRQRGIPSGGTIGVIAIVSVLSLLILKRILQPPSLGRS
ncbi:unnamed protein product [Cyprideis torosa]|uniref:Uncharacterized protein n=1 Tax=Cyprideis torosa TaxID=163714 RepID=A0A7R8W5G7_9CRUS|nr:unnamed protein product [Cyprideis torosa]CAG0885171.1 unnamed protein product [Cyprideis torosa]